jgi:hypothetical protein
MYQHDYAQPDSADAVEHIAAFLQELQDIGDTWDDIEAGEKVRTSYAVGESLRSLEQRGWAVYAARVPRRFRFGERGPMQLDVAMLVVARADNPRVTARGTEAEALPITWST